MYIVDIRKLSNQLSNLVAEYAYTTTVFGIILSLIITKTDICCSTNWLLRGDENDGLENDEPNRQWQTIRDETYA